MLKNVLLTILFAVTNHAFASSQDQLKVPFCNTIDGWLNQTNSNSKFENDIREQLNELYRFKVQNCYQGTHSFKTISTTKVGSQSYPEKITALYKEQGFYCYAKGVVRYSVVLDKNDKPSVKTQANFDVQFCNRYFDQELAKARTNSPNVKKIARKDWNKFKKLFKEDLNTGFTEMPDFDVSSIDSYVVYSSKTPSKVIGGIVRTVIASSEAGGPYFEYVYYNHLGQYVYTLRKDNTGW